MQNQITKKPPLFALIPVPYEALLDAGIEIGNPLQFLVEEGRITMEQIIPNEVDYVCDGNCQECPMILPNGQGCCEAWSRNEKWRKERCN